jgi:hypothetical protein
MIPNNLFEQLLDELKAKLNWGDFKTWTDKQFEALAEDILKKTGTAISVKTLKRVTGRIKYTHNHAQNYNPQLATKEALAQFLGYKSWQAYTKQYALTSNVAQSNEHEVDDVDDNKIHLTNSKRGYLLFAVAFTVLMVILWFTLYKGQEDFVFKVINREGDAPHNAIFNYKVGGDINRYQISYDDIYNLALGNYNVLKPEHNQGTLTYTYLMPDVYYPSLLFNGEKIATDTVLVKSGKWLANICYINNEKKYSYKILDKVNFFTDSGIYLPPNRILDASINAAGYFTEYRWFDAFTFTGDDLSIDFQFKNSLYVGGEHCQDVMLLLKCKLGIVKVKLLKAGCTQWAELVGGKKSKLGNKVDMRHFGVINDQLQQLNCRIKNQELIVQLDGKPLDSLTQIGDLGEVYGFIIIFKGSGIIHKLTMKSSIDKTLFEFNAESK